MFSSDFRDTCACESFTASGSVRSLPSADVVVLRDELGSLEGVEGNRSAADSIKQTWLYDEELVISSVICLPTKHLGVLKNSLKRVRPVRPRLN